jgi:acetyl-CoA acetyltransferase
VITTVVASDGIHTFGRFHDPVEDLAATAAREPLADAGVRFPEMDPTVVANVGEGIAKGQRIAGTLSATGRPVVSVESACASSASALLLRSLRSLQTDPRSAGRPRPA